MSADTDTRTPVRRLAEYRASDLRQGDRIRHQDRMYEITGIRTVVYWSDPDCDSVVLDLCALGAIDPISAQSMWGRTPADARSLTMSLMPDATLDVEEEHQ